LKYEIHHTTFNVICKKKGDGKEEKNFKTRVAVSA